jgi:hypothetical protein
MIRAEAAIVHAGTVTSLAVGVYVSMRLLGGGAPDETVTGGLAGLGRWTATGSGLAGLGRWSQPRALSGLLLAAAAFAVSWRGGAGAVLLTANSRASISQAKRCGPESAGAHAAASLGHWHRALAVVEASASELATTLGGILAGMAPVAGDSGPSGSTTATSLDSKGTAGPALPIPGCKFGTAYFIQPGWPRTYSSQLIIIWCYL